jgi:hypothetical protein
MSWAFEKSGQAESARAGALRAMPRSPPARSRSFNGATPYFRQSVRMSAAWCMGSFSTTPASVNDEIAIAGTRTPSVLKS